MGGRRERRISRCPRGERPLVELYSEPGVFSERCTEKLPLRVDCIHRLEFGEVLVCCNCQNWKSHYFLNTSFKNFTFCEVSLFFFKKNSVIWRCQNPEALKLIVHNIFSSSVFKTILILFLKCDLSRL